MTLSDSVRRGLTSAWKNLVNPRRAQRRRRRRSDKGVVVATFAAGDRPLPERKPE